MRVVGLWVHFVCACFPLFAQVDTTYIYNTNTPYGTLDIRIARSDTRYYYLQEDVTFSFRESAPGVKTNTFKDMTTWNSAPYRQGNLREKNGAQDHFIMNYRFLVPNGYDPGYEPGYPIILMLHGYGERGNCWDNSCYWSTPSWNPNTNSPPAPTDPNHSLLNNDHNLLHGGLKHLNAVNLAGSKLPDDPTLHPRSFPGFVLFPQSLNGWHQSARVEEAIRLLRLMIKKYNIDENRVYIHALSNGGGGLYQAVKRAPWLFAAALPMSAVSNSGAVLEGVIEQVAKVPFWTFQGAKDQNPTPVKTYHTIKALREAGAVVRYSLYPHLGHGTWNTAYNEPDFFSWMLSKRKNNMHVSYGAPVICNTNGAGAKFSFSDGFAAYQWEKDGVILSGETSSEYVATTPGTVRGRFSRKPNPQESDWEPWSDPMVVAEIQPEKPTIEALGTTHLRGPGVPGSTATNTVVLRAGEEADLYNWYKDGTAVDFSGTSVDDTLRTTTFVSFNNNGNGLYTLMTSESYCPSPPSDPVYLFFNNSAPQNIALDAETANFKGEVAGDGIFLTWNDVLTNETAYEVWRRKSGTSDFEFAGRARKDEISLYDGPLEPNVTYEYKFRAVNNSGTSNYLPSNDLNTNYQITTGDDTEPPTAPQGLKMIFNTINSFTLSWTHATDNTGIKEYIVSYGDESASTGSMINTFTIEGLPQSKEFPVIVRAVDHAGHVSPASNQIIATTFMLGLNYKHSTGGWEDLDEPSMLATWADPEFQGNVKNITLAPRTQEDFFNFQFTGYLDIDIAGNYQFSLKSDDGSRLLIDDSMVIDNDGLHGTRTVVSDTVFLAKGPHPIEVQYFEYSGGNNITLTFKGPGDFSGPFQNIPDSLFRSAKYVAGSPPPLPGGLEAQGAGMEQINLSWQSEAEVEVYRSSVSNGAYSIIGKSNSGAFADTVNLSPSTTYFYKVRSVNDSGASNLTGAVSATTVSDNVSPTAPTGLGLQTKSHTHIAITWEPSDDNVGVTWYEVFANGDSVGTATIPAFMIADLAPNTPYDITVKAVDASGNKSASSEELSVTTTSSATWYSLPNGNLNDVTTWKQNMDGSGGSPANFAENGQYFIIANRTATALGGPWNVTGNASKVVLPDGVTLTVDHPFNAGLELQGSSTLNLNHPDGPELVRISETSTINFNMHPVIPARKYGNIILGSGTSTKTFESGATEIPGNLTIAGGLVIKGAPGNGSSVIVGGDLIVNGSTDATAADNRININFTTSRTHVLSTDGHVYFCQFSLGAGGVVNVTGTGGIPVIHTGSLNGGGVTLASGSLLNISAGTLSLEHLGAINPQGGSGKLAVDGGNLFVRSGGTQPSNLNFDAGIHMLDTLWIDVSGPGVKVHSPVSITGVVKIKDGILNAGGFVTLLSTAEGTASIAEIEGDGEIIGNVTIQSYLAPLGNSWRELSTAVAGVKVAHWQNFFPITGSFSGSSGGPGEPSMFVVSGSNHIAYPPASGSGQSPIEKGMGYYTQLQNPDGITVEVTGHPFQGNVAYNVSAAGEGWNLVGNPYASSIAWSNDPEAWTSNGVSNTIAVKEVTLIDGQTVGRYHYFDRLLGNGIVKPGQAFWVQAFGTSPALTSAEKAKTFTHDEYPVQDGVANYLRIKLAKGNKSDEAWILFNENATSAFDDAFEALKLPNEGLFNLSTLVTGNMEVAVNYLPSGFCSETVSLSLDDVAPGNYSLEFSGLETLTDIGSVKLNDHFAGTSTLLTSGAVDFAVTDDPNSSGNARFSLTFDRNILDTSSPQVSAEDVCAGDPAEVIITPAQEGVDYTVMNLDGEPISPVVSGDGDMISIPLYDSLLVEGVNHARVLAGLMGCSAEYLDAEVEFTYTGPFEIEVPEEVSVCAGDQAVIQASGVAASGHYQWLDENHQVIDSEVEATLVTTPVLQETVYYVSGVLANGCESGIKSVHIFPDSLDVPVITVVNDTLFTQVEATFQWKRNGSVIEGAIKAYYVPQTSGVYSVIAFNGGCVRESADFQYTKCEIDRVGPAVSAENSCGDDPAIITIDNSQDQIEYFAINIEDETISEVGTGNGATIVLTIPAVNLDSGSNDVRIVAHQPGCTDEILESVVTFQYIPISIPVILEADGTLTTNSTGEIQWKKDGEPIAGENESTFTPTESGSYTVVVVAGDCSSESEPYELLITSLDQDTEFVLSVFPVPARADQLTVSLRSPNPDDIYIRVFSMAGKLVHTEYIGYYALSHGIPLQPESGPLTDGVYIILVNQGAREIRRKIVIRD